MADAHIRVASATPVASLASAIANCIYEGNTVVLQMIGAAAISQAVKAIAVAAGFTAMPPWETGLSAKPRLEDIRAEDGTVTTRVLIRVFPDGQYAEQHEHARQHPVPPAPAQHPPRLGMP